MKGKSPKDDYLSWHTQIEHARLLARDCEKVVPESAIGEEDRRELERGLAEQLSREVRGVSFEDSVVIDLEKGGFEGFERETSPWEEGGGVGMLKIDIAWKEEKVALELDGPSHFLTGCGTRNGSTKAKTELLSALGWKVERFAWFNNVKLQVRRG